MERRLPEQCGRGVLAVYRSNRVGASQALRYSAIRLGFVTPGQRFSDLSDGIDFLMRYGYLSRGMPDPEGYYLTDSGAQAIAGRIELAVGAPAGEGNASSAKDHDKARSSRSATR